MTENKRCPFCNTKVTESKFNANYIAHGSVPCVLGGQEFPKVAWNMRPIEQELEAEIARLRGLIQKQIIVLGSVDSKLDIISPELEKYVEQRR